MYLLSEVTSLHYFHFKSLIRDLYEVNIGEYSCANVVDEVSFCSVVCWGWLVTRRSKKYQYPILVRPSNYSSS